MANWKYKINLNGLITTLTEEYDLTDDDSFCPDPVKKQLAEEVKKAFPLSHFAVMLLEAETVGDVNSILADIFDDADRKLVWCGFPE